MRIRVVVEFMGMLKLTSLISLHYIGVPNKDVTEYKSNFVFALSQFF